MKGFRFTSLPPFPGFAWRYHDLTPSPDAGTRIAHGRAGFGDAWLEGLDESFALMLCLGQHAMAGTPRAVCPHSLWHVNDRHQLSETTMAAALAGELGLPCVFVSGDDKICAECAGWIEGLHTCVVKQGLAPERAISLAPAEARARIRDGVRAAVRDAHRVQPMRLPGPFSLNLSDRDPNRQLLDRPVTGDRLWPTMHAALEAMGARFGEQPIDDKTMRWPAKPHSS